MATLLSCQSITKTFGNRSLFENITLGILEGDKIGLIGPNGSGKSTLLKILAKLEEPDSGNLSVSKSTRLGYLSQKEVFDEKLSVEKVLIQALSHQKMEEFERATQAKIILGKFGFNDKDQKVSQLSGGWRKRLALGCEFIKNPDLLLLDEPTNHLDLEGILWLEKLLKSAPFTYLVVSHDRVFLENVTTKVAELNRRYPQGYFQINGAYSDFLAKREEFFEGQQQQEESLKNKVNREIDWLRRGPKARTTKANSRITEAHELIAELKDVRSRNSQTNTATIDFTSSDRRTKRLLHAEAISKSFGDRPVFKDLTFTLSPGMRVGLAGLNGSGKTTLIRLLTGEIKPDKGHIDRAPNLKIVTFDQKRKPLDVDSTLKKLLAPDGDQVNYRGSSIHVTSWARRFLFEVRQLEMPVKKLSGGEQARVLIAQLMLQPADILILDEPTNDLDIPTLEVLEESLIEFPGALILVTHDRYLLDRVSNVILGLRSGEQAEVFAEYSQWEQSQLRSDKPSSSKKATTGNSEKTDSKSDAKKNSNRLSYNEQREFDKMEQKIAEAEQALSQCQDRLSDPVVINDANLLQKECDQLNEAQEMIDKLYARWEELQKKQGS